VAQLCQRTDELKVLNTQVLLVTFSSAGYARKWSQETCAPFRLLLDRERVTYVTYGLERSLARSWNVRTIRRYAKLLSSGREWKGIQGDSAQLGGDFIIDAQGVVQLAYRSHDPTDRPEADDLLELLRGLPRVEQAERQNGKRS
jgi:peroxiredoxin